MTNKIGGYGNRPVQTGAGKTVSRERDAGTSASKSAEAGKAATPVRVSEQARQLAALERAVHDVVTALRGVDSVCVDLATKDVVVTGTDLVLAERLAAIDEAGYEAVPAQEPSR